MNRLLLFFLIVTVIICLNHLRNDFISASVIVEDENEYLNVASSITTLQEKKEFIKNHMLIESTKRLIELEKSYFTKQAEIYFLNATISSQTKEEIVNAEQLIKKAETQLVTISSTSNVLKFNIKLASTAFKKLEENISALMKSVNPSLIRFAINGINDGLLMIKENSEIYGIGYNADGNLGCGNNINPITTPCKVIDNNGVLKGKAILQMKSQRHTVILTTDNLLISFGYAPLGDGKGISSNVPVFVQNSFFIDKQIKQLEVGHDNTLVMTNDGNVYGWGFNSYRELCSTGAGKVTPTLITPPTGKKFKKVFYQMVTSLFLMEDGDVYYCGVNPLNAVAAGSLTKMDVKAIDQTIEPIEAIVAGDRIIIYRTKSGNLYSYGYGGYYTLGFGDSNAKSVPTLIPYFSSAGISISKVCSGKKHVIALSTEGKVYQWGINPATGDVIYIPSRFTGNEIENYKIVDIYCGGNINIAVSEEEKVVFGWGKGYLFGLGASIVPTPTKLTLP